MGKYIVWNQPQKERLGQESIYANSHKEAKKKYAKKHPRVKSINIESVKF